MQFVYDDFPASSYAAIGEMPFAMMPFLQMAAYSNNGRVGIVAHPGSVARLSDAIGIYEYIYHILLLLLLLECIMYKSTLGESCPMQHCVVHNKTSL